MVLTSAFPVAGFASIPRRKDPLQRNEETDDQKWRKRRGLGRRGTQRLNWRYRRSRNLGQRKRGRLGTPDLSQGAGRKHCALALMHRHPAANVRQCKRSLPVAAEGRSEKRK